MNFTRDNLKLSGRQRGVSLIEMMVALTISLMVLSGASVILVNANKSSRIQDDLVGMQENARFAIQQIADDIRMSGYYGCVEDINPVDPNGPIINNLSSNDYLASPVRGYEHSGTPVTTLTDDSRDVLEIQYANPVTTMAATMDSPQSDITVADTSGISVGDVLMVATCETGDIFAVSGLGAGTLQHQTDATSGGDLVIENNSDSLSALYPQQTYAGIDNSIYRFNRIKYSIADDGGVPALFRAVNQPLNTPGDPFIRGVDAFEVLYGEDTNNDSIPDSYVAADAVTNWGNISAIRFALLMRTENQYGSDFDRADESGDTIAVLGSDFDVGDERVRRRTFQTTVFVRNSI
ncbi:MAG: PilW family protein [Arenicellales bacterium]